MGLMSLEVGLIPNPEMIEYFDTCIHGVLGFVVLFRNKEKIFCIKWYYDHPY